MLGRLPHKRRNNMTATRSRPVNTKLMSLDLALVDAVWERARATAEADPATWRLDTCGAWIRRDQFDRNDSDFGWRIESVAAGRPTEPASLRALHWRNHFDVANNQPQCSVRADRSGAPAGEYVSPPRNREI